MRKYINLMLAVMCGSVLSACSSYNYYTAAANKTNLTQYKTFALATPQKNPNKQWRPLNEIGDGKLQEAIKATLPQKGLVMSNQNPDLLVTYATVTSRGTKVQYSSPYYGGFYGGGGWGWGGWGWGGGWYRPYYGGFYGGGFYGPGFAPYGRKVTYKEGTVIIDLIDSRTRTIVWRGYGVGELYNPKQTMKDIPKVVEGIFKQLSLVPTIKS